MDIWKHGTYVDLWSVVHFLSGLILAPALMFAGYSFYEALVYAALLLVAWEAFEWLIRIIEPSLNVLFDLLIGVAGFLVGAYLYYVVNVSPVVMYGAVAAALSLAVWGFLDFSKRGYR